jgi:hypothetical protein
MRDDKRVAFGIREKEDLGLNTIKTRFKSQLMTLKFFWQGVHQYGEPRPSIDIG